VPKVATSAEVVDLSYLRTLAAKSNNVGTAEKVEYSGGTRLARVVGTRNVQITFATGKATLTEVGEAQMESLFETLSINNLTIEVHGHTDNVGDPLMNKQLSEERALAIKAWLQNKNPTDFPSGRIRVTGHGSDSPIATNATADGRAKNRRVEIVIGQ